MFILKKGISTGLMIVVFAFGSTVSLSGNSSDSRAAATEIDWMVMSSGGVEVSSASFRLRSTLGQNAAFVVSSSSFTVNSGYWQSLSCCGGTTGDFDSDGTVHTIFDVTFLVDFIFKGGEAPLCFDVTDVNEDGNDADVIDLNYMIDDIFRGGPPPVPCP